jgi:hypothetical protein
LALARAVSGVSLLEASGAGSSLQATTPRLRATIAGNNSILVFIELSGRTISGDEEEAFRRRGLGLRRKYN